MGYAWNHTRVYRIYKQLGLNLRRRVKHRLPERVKQPLVAPLSPNAGWSMDFMSDSSNTGVRHFTPIFAPFRKVPSAPARVSRP